MAEPGRLVLCLNRAPRGRWLSVPGGRRRVILLWPDRPDPAPPPADERFPRKAFVGCLAPGQRCRVGSGRLALQAPPAKVRRSYGIPEAAPRTGGSHLLYSPRPLGARVLFRTHGVAA